ncbi:hypothetical protein Hanom_Chr04g00296421 [Helianthus anomalus]
MEASIFWSPDGSVVSWDGDGGGRLRFKVVLSSERHVVALWRFLEVVAGGGG